MEERQIISMIKKSPTYIIIYMATLHVCENICLYSAKKEEERKHLFVLGQKRRRKKKTNVCKANHEINRMAKHVT